MTSGTAETTIITSKSNDVGINGSSTNVVGIDIQPIIGGIAEDTELSTAASQHIEDIIICDAGCRMQTDLNEFFVTNSGVYSSEEIVVRSDRSFIS